MSPYRDEAAVHRDVLVCAGLDPCGGAGLIADARVLSELGARPVGVVTALTVQNTTGVLGCTACDAEVVGHQLEFLLTDVEVRAAKIGMIGSTAIAKAIASALHLTRAPVVWDPILFPSRGDVPLVDSLFGEAVIALRPHLALVTPNARELAFLAARPVRDHAEAEAAARVLSAKLDTAVLSKGGHLGGDDSIDVLVHAGGREELRGPRVAGGEHVHGTGCALASAIAAYLARSPELPDLVDACRKAKAYVAARIASPARPGRGAASVV
jgi:hydroxymethylpyrimidine/phosphomethylpyrimidine kinase